MSDDYGQQWSSAPASTEESTGSAEPVPVVGGWTDEATAPSSDSTNGVQDTWTEAPGPWFEVRGGQGAGEAGPDAASDFRLRPEMELRTMAARPNEANANWANLTDQDKAVVVQFMGEIFDTAFAQAFTVTPADFGMDSESIQNVAPSQVEAAGYQYGHNEGNFRIYYRPSGRRYQLQVFHNASRADENVGTEEDAGVLDQARGECDSLDSWLSEVRSLSAQARQRTSADDYPVAFCRVQRSMYALGRAIDAASERSATWRVSAAAQSALNGYVSRVEAYYSSWQSQALANETWAGLPSPRDADGNFVDCDQVLANAGG